MEFGLSEEQQLLKDSIARFVEREYAFDQRQRLITDGGGFSAANWRIFAEMGWLMLGIPADHGGLGGSAVDTAIVMEEFGKALVVEPFLHVAIQVARVLIEAGDESGLVEAIGNGEAMPVLAHSEADAYGMLNWVETQAEKSGAGWKITGSKSLVNAAPFASHFIVSARTSGEAGDEDGIGLFLLAPDAAGLKRHDGRLADGSRAADISFNNCKGQLIGPQGESLPILKTTYAHATIALAAEAVGVMDKSLWTTRDYLQTREQFGAAIGSFQALQHRMADMLIELEMARAQVYRALAYLDADPLTRDMAVSSMKVQIGRSAKYIGAQSIQLHGGMGMTEEYSIGHYFRRLCMIESAFGNTSVHLDQMATLDRKAA